MLSQRGLCTALHTESHFLNRCFGVKRNFLTLSYPELIAEIMAKFLRAHGTMRYIIQPTKPPLGAENACLRLFVPPFLRPEAGRIHLLLASPSVPIDPLGCQREVNGMWMGRGSESLDNK